MTKKELFAKYGINESHNQWQPTPDNWMSVEIYRAMHDGNLPEPDDMSIAYVVDFLDKTKDPQYFFSLPNAGSMFLTARRMVYRHADAIIKELEAR